MKNIYIIFLDMLKISKDLSVEIKSSKLSNYLAETQWTGYSTMVCTDFGVHSMAVVLVMRLLE